MKLSNLFKNDNWGAYIIGTIYSYQYKHENKFISFLKGKNQKSTGHQIETKIFLDQLKRIESFYSVKISHLYSPINSSKELNKKIKSSSVGIYSLFENDIEGDIYYKILEKLDNKIFAKNLIRGIIDSRSSGDKTTNFIAMDIRKQYSVSFSIIIQKSFDIIFGEGNLKYNINPRFKQPSKISRTKNPQFRIPYQIVFGEIGTFRKQFLEKARLNKNVWKKLSSSTNMPKKFKDIIYWDTSNMAYNPRSSNNRLLLQGDVEYLKNYSNNNEGLLYLKLKELYSREYSFISKKREKFSEEEIENVLSKTNMKDFLEPKKKIEKNKKNEPLLDIHHIIPYRYRHFFDNKNTINEIENLIPLRPDTHYFLHRGIFNEKKIKYLEILYKEVNSFLIREKLKEKIDFATFKSMY